MWWGGRVVGVVVLGGGVDWKSTVPVGMMALLPMGGGSWFNVGFMESCDVALMSCSWSHDMAHVVTSF
jgi:hypothetical protein